MMGLGGPGVRESKQVSTSTEFKIPFMQFFGIWFAGMLISFFGYLVLKMFITDRGDWSLFIGLLTPVAFIAGAIFFERQIAKKYFPNVWRDFLEWNKRVLDRDDFGPVILYLFVVCTLLLVAGWFYLTVIVPQLTALFDQRAHFVFVLCSFVSLIIAARPYYTFNKRQLTDSLRDSDSRYAIRALELENERFWKMREEEREIPLLPAGEEEESKFPMPVLIRAPEGNLPDPTEADHKFKLATMDFLEGIAAGEWSTNERSWRNSNGRVKVLPNTGHRVMSIGRQIRDELIRAGWASWKNPDDRSAGWDLNFDIAFIEREAFNDENRVRQAPTAPSKASRETLAGDYEVFMADDESPDNGEGDFD